MMLGRNAMKNNDVKSLIVPALLVVVWGAAMFIFKTDQITDDLFLTTCTAGAIAALVSCAYLLGFFDAMLKTDEIQYTSLVYTDVYLFVVLAINFIVSQTNYKLSYTIFINLVCLCIYLGLIIFSHSYATSTDTKVNLVESNVQTHHALSQKMGEILACATDPDVKKRLLELKQFLDYSNASSNQSKLVVENELYDQLNELQALLDEKTDTSRIIEHIDKLMTNVKTRNAIR